MRRLGVVAQVLTDVARALAAVATDAETRIGAAALAEASRRRLRLMGVADDFITKLEQGGEVSRVLPLRSPAGGVVTMREAYAGMAVEPGMELLQVADLAGFGASEVPRVSRSVRSRA